MRVPGKIVRRVLVVAVVVMLVALSGFVAWSSSVNPIMPQAAATLEDTAAVDVTEGAYISFVPKDATPTVGYIFYLAGGWITGLMPPMPRTSPGTATWR